jgi:carbamoyl-phosphate synthase large subunit
MPLLRLLVLSAGTRVGQHVLSTLASRRTELFIGATSSVSHEPSLFDFDAVWLVPQTAREPRAWQAQVLDIAAREAIDLVIPCRDDDVNHLSALRDERPDLARRLLCGSADAARTIADKPASARFCAEHRLPFVPTLWDATRDERAAFVARHGFPLVAKPPRGYASLDVYLLWNERQLDHALDVERFVVQQFLGDPTVVERFLADSERRGLPLHHTFQGVKHSIQALIAPDGAVAHVICTRNVSKHRRSKWVEPDEGGEARAIGKRCAAAFAVAGWRGPLNIQCQRAPSGDLLIHEFNGRFTGGTVDRWLLGFDEVGAAIRSFTGHGPAGDGLTHVAREAFEWVIARAADPAHVDALARDGTWRRVR